MGYTSVILHGFRASGKSTIGKRLSEKLQWKFADMDSLITYREGKSIHSITQNGTSWEPFRKLEHNLLKELINEQRIVISTGGGVAVNTIYGHENSKIIKEAKHFLPIVLVADAAILMERIRNGDNSFRPILDEKIAKHTSALDALIETEMHLYESRKSLYQAQSPHIFDTGNDSVDTILTKITALIYA